MNVFQSHYEMMNCKMNINLSLTICLLLLLQIGKGMCQTISRVSTIQSGDRLIINYDLNGGIGETFDIYPCVITRSGRQIRPVSMYGDLRSVKSGNNLSFTWQVLDDVSDLEGEIAVMLEAKEVQISFTSNTNVANRNELGGGPANAFLSMLLPGLGDVFVNERNKIAAIKPSYIAVAYLSSIGLAYYSYTSMKENYISYQKATQQYEMNDYYENAIYYRDNANLFTVLACTIWITDVARVAIKGAQNRRVINQQNKHKISLNGSMLNNTPTLLLTCKF